MSDERNCPNCIHKKEHGCEMWECDYSPKDDCISRQAVQDYIAKYLSQFLYNDVREAVETIDAYIGEMPSVTPTDMSVIEDIKAEIEDAKYAHYGQLKGTKNCLADGLDKALEIIDKHIGKEKE